MNAGQQCRSVAATPVVPTSSLVKFIGQDFVAVVQAITSFVNKVVKGQVMIPLS